MAEAPSLDPHGQPINLSFNRKRRTERDLSELLGLTKGMLCDGVVTDDEATYLKNSRVFTSSFWTVGSTTPNVSSSRTCSGRLLEGPPPCCLAVKVRRRSRSTPRLR